MADLATLGGGCFWCVEAVFRDLKGVIRLESGYAGGMIENPTYEQICTGKTGHAEVLRIEFDSQVITYRELLRVFFHTHDPTTLNRQGNDVGTQYRSVIFFHSGEQEQAAKEVREEIAVAGVWEDPLVTEIVPLSNYFSAEDYHQDFFYRNPEQGYCNFVIPPKLKKLRERFPHLLSK